MGREITAHFFNPLPAFLLQRATKGFCFLQLYMNFKKFIYNFRLHLAVSSYKTG